MTLDNFNLSSSGREIINSFADKNAFPHTMLIEGSTPQERTDFANFLANMILCASDGKKPCGICRACIKCAANSNPDIKAYGEDKSGSSFKVELSREIRQDAFVLPNDSDKKVYILKGAQNMNDSSENALLKILEEPPRFDFFILTCESKNSMLDTILSRSSVISLGEAKREFSPQAVETAEKIALSLIGTSELATLEALSQLSAKKDMFEDTAECIKVIFTDCVKFKQTQINESAYFKTVEKLCNRFSQKKLFSFLNIISRLELRFKQNANYNLLITSMCAELCGAVGK